MARKKTKRTTKTTDFRHKSAKRTNIPPAKIAGEGTVPDAGMKKYAYSPHLSPVLRFDPETRADTVREVVEKAVSGKGLDEAERCGLDVCARAEATHCRGCSALARCQGWQEQQWRQKVMLAKETKHTYYSNYSRCSITIM